MVGGGVDFGWPIGSRRHSRLPACATGMCSFRTLEFGADGLLAILGVFLARLVGGFKF